MTRLTAFDRNRFDTDKAIGNIAENIWSEYLNNSWEHVIDFKAPNNKPFADYDFQSHWEPKDFMNNPEYDISCPVLTWEIKHDTANSLNIPIQFYQSSKAATKETLSGTEYSCNSGIFGTKADFYVTYCSADSMFYLAPTKDLQDYLRKNSVRKAKANIGKSEFTAIALIPKKDWPFYKLRYIPPVYQEL
jgi:hypothetical protein